LSWHFRPLAVGCRSGCVDSVACPLAKQSRPQRVNAIVAAVCEIDDQAMGHCQAVAFAKEHEVKKQPANIVDLGDYRVRRRRYIG
jgi:hypothetical protein